MEGWQSLCVGLFLGSLFGSMAGFGIFMWGTRTLRSLLDNYSLQLEKKNGIIAILERDREYWADKYRRSIGQSGISPDESKAVTL